MSWFTRLQKFSPDQPRDGDGRWSAGGLGSRIASNLISKLKGEGGFTYQPVTKDMPKPGDPVYAVAYSKDTERVYPLGTFKPSLLQGFVKENWTDLRQPDHYLGGWVDGGKAYIDCSIVTPDEERAIKVAKDANQLAYFSFKDMTPVDTPNRASVHKGDAKVHLAPATAEGVISLYEALTGQSATPEEIAEVRREFAHLSQ
jgi:hypothetical protein